MTWGLTTSNGTMFSIRGIIGCAIIAGQRSETESKTEIAMNDSEVLTKIKEVCARMIDGIDKLPFSDRMEGERWAYKVVLDMIEGEEVKCE